MHLTFPLNSGNGPRGFFPVVLVVSLCLGLPSDLHGVVSGSRSCCLSLSPSPGRSALGATRSSAGFHYLRFRIRTSPIDSFYPADVLTACGVPTGYERIDDAVETHQRGECALVIRRLLDALEATDGPSTSMSSTSTTLLLVFDIAFASFSLLCSLVV